MSVPLCIGEESKTCSYSDHCWFRHERESMNSNQEMTEKIFNMMEKFTKRMIDVENMIKSLQNNEQKLCRNRMQ